MQIYSRKYSTCSLIVVLCLLFIQINSQKVFKAPSFFTTFTWTLGGKTTAQSGLYPCAPPSQLKNVRKTVLAFTEIQRLANNYISFKTEITPTSGSSITVYSVNLTIISTNYLDLKWWVIVLSDSSAHIWLDCIQLELKNDANNLLNNNAATLRTQTFDTDITATTIFPSTNNLKLIPFITCFEMTILNPLSPIEHTLTSTITDTNFIKTLVSLPSQIKIITWKGVVLVYHQNNINSENGVVAYAANNLAGVSSWHLANFYPQWGPPFTKRCFTGFFKFQYLQIEDVSLHFLNTGTGNLFKLDISTSGSIQIDVTFFCLSDGSYQCGQTTRFYDKFADDCYTASTCPLPTVDPGSPYISRQCKLCTQIDCDDCLSTDRTNCTACSLTNHSTVLTGDCECNVGYYRSVPTIYCQVNCTYHILGCELSHCTSLTYCTQCNPGYYLLIVDATNKICKACNQTIDNCSICSNQNICSICSTGFYQSSTTNAAGTAILGCASCNLLFLGCIDCDSTTCLDCSPGYIVNTPCQCDQLQIPHCFTCTTAFKCDICEVDYFVKPVTMQCEPCTSISHCTNCTNYKTCTTCDDLYVLKTYTANASNLCVSCSILIPNCYNCTSQSTCTLCQLQYGFHLNTSCISCLSLFSYCLYCYDYNACTQCIHDGRSHLYSGGCVHCSDIDPSCDLCTVTGSGSIICSSCNIGHFLIPADNLCYKCSEYIDDCLECTYDGVTKCTLCSALFIVDSNFTCNLCKDPKLKYVTRTCTNVSGCSSSQVVGGKVICLACDALLNFQYNSVKKSCQCSYGYVFDKSTESCYEKCGDGITVSAKCDDGNKVNGDGCSDACQQQEGFECTINQIDLLSNCVLSSEIIIVFEYIIRNLQQNKADLYFKITPSSVALNKVNWQSTITFDFDKIVKAGYKYSAESGVLIMQVQYNADIESQNITLDFSFNSKIVSSASKQLSLQFSSINGPLTYDSDSGSNNFTAFKVTGLVIGVFCFALFLLSSYFHKMIGLQTIQFVQLIYFMRIMSTKVSQTSFYAFNSLKHSNGYNQLSSSHQDIETYKSLPPSFIKLDMSLYFLDNCNLMLIPLLISSIAFIIYSLQKLYYKNRFLQNRQKQNKDKYTIAMRKVNWIYNNFIFTFTLALFYMINFSAVSYLLSTRRQTYSEGNSQFFIDFSFGAHCLIAYFVSMIYCFQLVNGIIKYKQLNSKQNIKSSSKELDHDSNTLDNGFHPLYISLYLSYQFLLILSMMLIFINFEYIIETVLSLSIGYFIIILVWNPYVLKFNNLAIFINQFNICLFLCLQLLIKLNLISNTIFKALSYIILVSLSLSILLSYFRVYIHVKTQLNATKSKQALRNKIKDNDKNKILNKQHNKYIFNQQQSFFNNYFQSKNEHLIQNQNLSGKIKTKNQNKKQIQINLDKIENKKRNNNKQIYKGEQKQKLKKLQQQKQQLIESRQDNLEYAKQRLRKQYFKSYER